MMEIKYGTDFDYEFNHMSQMRFREIEIAHFVNHMKEKYGQTKGKRYTITLFKMVSDMDQHRLIEAIEAMEKQIVMPTKKEWLIFLLFYKRLSQYKTKQFANNSPNFINQVRKEFIEEPYQLTPIAMDHTVILHGDFLDVLELLSTNDKVCY